jgi:cytochrome P450
MRVLIGLERSFNLSFPAAASPASPDAPVYFDVDLRAWVFCKGEAVLAALRAPELVQADAWFRPAPRRADQSTHSRQVTEFLTARLQAVRPTIESITQRASERLPSNGRCELVSEWIQPWSIDVMQALLEPRDVQKLLYRFAARYAPGNPRSHRVGRIRRRIAAKLTAHIFPGVDGDNAESALRRSVFLGVTQTLPAFLASAWYWLLLHPAEVVRLRSGSENMPIAMERLLGQAGHVHTLYRVVASPCSVHGAQFSAGDRVLLRLDSANRDLAELNARSCSHVSLGAGPHACAGAGAVRVLAAMATIGMLRRWPDMKLSGEAEWSEGATLSSPISLPVVFASAPDCCGIVNKL